MPPCVTSLLIPRSNFINAAPPALCPLAARAALLRRAPHATAVKIPARCTNSVPSLRPNDCESLPHAHASQLQKLGRRRDLHLFPQCLLPARKGFLLKKCSDCGFLCVNACGIRAFFLYLLFFYSFYR